MKARCQPRHIAAIRWHTQPDAERIDQGHTFLFMAVMPRQQFGRRHALAQVVRQRGKACGQWRGESRGHVDDQHHMYTGVDFRMVVGALRHAPQRIEFRQQLAQRATFAQHREHARGRGFHQPA